MVVYVVFVTIIVATADARLPALHLRRDPALEVVHRDDRRLRPSSIVGKDQLIKQIQFPKIVLPTAAAVAGIVSFAFGLVGARTADAVLPGSDLAIPAAHPGDRERPVRVHPGVRLPGRRGQRLLPRPRQRRDATCCACGGSCRRACTASPSLDELEIFKEHPILRTIAGGSTRSRSCSRPIGRSSTGRRRRRSRRACPTSPRWPRCSSRASSSSAFTTSSSSGSSRTSRRSSDGRRDSGRRGSSRGADYAITASDLGVSYDLRFTRKTTIRELDRPDARARPRRQVLGAAPRRPARPARRVAGGHRPERRRQEHAPPGPGRDHPPVRGRRSTSSATSPAC